jgi:hypothetical protein
MRIFYVIQPVNPNDTRIGFEFILSLPTKTLIIKISSNKYQDEGMLIDDVSLQYMDECLHT